MNKFITIAIGAGVLFIILAGCQSAGTGGDQSSDNGDSCLCKDGKSGKDVWCASCNVGYIDSEKIECKGCYVGKKANRVCIDNK